MRDKFVSILASSAKFDWDMVARKRDDDMAEVRAIKYICEEVAKRMLGQSCSRANWTVEQGKCNKVLPDTAYDPLQDKFDREFEKARYRFHELKELSDNVFTVVGKGLVQELEHKARMGKLMLSSEKVALLINL